MKLEDISALGWFHTVPCMAALILGAVILVTRKGTRRHRLLGDLYFFAMLSSCLSGLPIMKGDLTAPGVLTPGAFAFFHWLTLATLFILVVGYFTASRQSHSLAAYLHPACMIVSYYLLIGGGINEIYARVSWLHRLAMGHRHGISVAGTPMVLMTHSFFLLTTLLLLGIAFAQVARRPKSRPEGHGVASVAA